MRRKLGLIVQFLSMISYSRRLPYVADFKKRFAKRMKNAQEQEIFVNTPKPPANAAARRSRIIADKRLFAIFA